MSSGEATTGYQAIIQELLTRPPAYQARAVSQELSEEPRSTVAEEDDRGTLRPARGIVFAILLGAAIWGLVIGGLLIGSIR